MEFRVYIARRLIQFVLVVFGVVILAFLVTHVIPGNPVRALLGPTATPAQVAALTHKYGLDQPLYLQFVHYLENLAVGNLGVSIFTNNPVTKDLALFLPATLELTALAFIVAVAFGIIFGSVSALTRGRMVDQFVRVFSLIGISTPPFWLGVIAVILFSVTFHIFPTAGALSSSLMIGSPLPGEPGFLLINSLLAGNLTYFWNALWHLELPALVLGFWGAGWISRHVRTSILEVEHKDFVTMARAKGLSRKAVFFRHILRNGLIPPLTIMGLTFGYMLSGAITVEIVFAYPGIGLYAYNAFLNLDYAPIAGVALVVAVFFSALNLAVDLLYPIVDPRIKVE